MRPIAFRAPRLCCGLPGLLLIAACSRNEPQPGAASPATAGASQTGEAAPGVASSASGPAAPAASAETPPQEEGLPGFDEALEKLRNMPVIRPSAEITLDGKPWGDPEKMKILGNDLWIGFSIDIESGTGEKITIQVPRGAQKGERVTGADLHVAYVRGKETWLKHEEQTFATITDWNNEYPRPVVSLDVTAALRREQRPAKTMKVEASISKVIIADDPKKPDVGLEKQSDQH